MLQMFKLVSITLLIIAHSTICAFCIEEVLTINDLKIKMEFERKLTALKNQNKTSNPTDISNQLDAQYKISAKTIEPKKKRII